MPPFSRLLDALHDVPDPRRAEGKRYPLPHLLLFTVLALLSGARSYRGVITFLDQRRLTLNELFGAEWKRAPSLNALRNLLHGLDSAALEAAFRQHATGLFVPSKDAEMPLVAFDGKVLKGSFDHLNDRRAAQALTAFASEAALLLAQVDIEDKDSEIPAAQRLIGELGVKGILFTADALHCQKNV